MGWRAKAEFPSFLPAIYPIKAYFYAVFIHCFKAERETQRNWLLPCQFAVSSKFGTMTAVDR